MRDGVLKGVEQAGRNIKQPQSVIAAEFAVCPTRPKPRALCNADAQYQQQKIARYSLPNRSIADITGFT